MNNADMIKTIIAWGPDADFSAKIDEHFPTATEAEIEQACRAAVAKLRVQARRKLVEADTLERFGERENMTR